MRRREGDDHTLSSGFETNLTIFEGHNIQKERFLIMYLTQTRRGGGEKGRFFLFFKVEEEASPNPQVGGKMPSAPAQNPAEDQQWYA